MFVPQMEEMPGGNHCRGLTYKSHAVTAAQTHTHPETFTGRHTHTQTRGEDSPTHRLASPIREADLAMAHSPGSTWYLKNSPSHLHAHLETSVYPLCFRCPWRPPKPCSSACWSWQSLKAGVGRGPPQVVTCTVSNPGSRELGGSKELDQGAGAPSWSQYRGDRKKELGEPLQRHHLPLACLLLAFNVTVRSDRQGTCQGSHVAQACVGHCESSAFPSRYSVLLASGYRHNITSVSQCCTITGLRKVRGPAPWWLIGGRGRQSRGGLRWPEEGDCNLEPPLPQVKVQLHCGGDRREELEIFTARACQCDMCRLSRY